ncbi:MAG: glutathione synthase [Gammaproteobacteria bacterium]
MSIKLGIVMDPIAGIDIKKDSSFAMLLAAQARGWPLYYMELADLFLDNARAFARMRELAVEDRSDHWYRFIHEQTRPVSDLDVVLMRKDPPVNMEYIYATYLLELAEAAGVLVVNAPRSLRDANEKLFTSWFPQCCPPSLVTRSRTRIKEFLEVHGDIILKPLDGMGGVSIFRVRGGDPNTNVIIETLTGHGSQFTMAQRFVPEIVAGDKRILLIDGEPAPFALARTPAPGETRGNLAAGGMSKGVALNERDYWICSQVRAALCEKGLVFVGLDVIGDYLTEINVTSPTCIREIDALYGLDIAAELMGAIERRLSPLRG